jgi:hypothetical protein
LAWSENIRNCPLCKKSFTVKSVTEFNLEFKKKVRDAAIKVAAQADDEEDECY